MVLVKILDDFAWVFILILMFWPNKMFKKMKKEDLRINITEEKENTDSSDESAIDRASYYKYKGNF